MFVTKFKPTKRGLLESRTADIFAENYTCFTDGRKFGQPFIIEDWQYRNIWTPIFGCVNSKGERKFDKYMFLLPRDHGKSELMPRVVLTHATLYPAFNGEYGIFASSKEQAKIIYNKLSVMIRQNPQLAASWEVMKKEIVNKETGSRIRVFPCNDSEAQGIHFTLAIIDELHVIKSAGMYESITSGMIHVDGSILICISTAGAKREGYLYDELIPLYKSDPKSYMYWVGVEENDNPEDRKCWKKVMVASWRNYDKLEEAFNQTSKNAFMRYQLNQFPPKDDNASYVFTDEQLSKVVRTRKEWDWNGRIVLGIDGAQSGDNFALIYARRDDDGKLGIYPIIFDKVQTARGHYDLTLVEEIIADSYANHDIENISMDPARLLLMSQHMEKKYGIEFEAFAQNHKMMSGACAYLYREVVSGRVRVYGDQKEDFVRHLSHCTRIECEPYGFRFGKARSEEKIDAAIAGSIAAIKVDTLPQEQDFEAFYI